MKVLSLFDGMACGMIAMQLAGVEVESYDAYEIDKYAIKTAQHNFPMIKEHGDVFNADFTQYEGVDFLVGGSPCTYWSIAQTKNRETVASGMGWELFSQYVRALHEAKPKYFIYENNKSMSKQIRASIDKAFGFEAVLINSALVSAQNRQRLYWVGIRNEDGSYSKVNVEQPADRGILLKDVLDSAVARDLTSNDKAYTLTASYDGACAWNTIERHQRNMVAEPVSFSMVGDFGNRKVSVSDKAYCLAANPSSDMSARVAEPINVTADGKAQCLRATCYKDGIRNIIANEIDKKTGVAEPINDIYQVGAMPRPDGKTNTLTTVLKDNQIMEPLQYAELSEEYYKGCADGNLVGMIENKGKYKNGKQPSQQYRVYSCEDKSVCVDADQRKHYIIPYSIEFDDDGRPIKSIGKDGKEITIYEVKDGKITIKGKQYPIKLKDGYYIIRKLTVSECKRLQTVPEWYEFPVSNSQAYKMLGNGWTVDVIAHILKGLKEAKEEEQ